MGFFSDKCLVCGYHVKKSAKFCSKCGLAAPRGMTTCGRCGANVGTESQHCHKCGAELDIFKEPPVFDNHWAREKDDFAAVIFAEELEGWLKKVLYVDPGTQAMLYQRGHFRGILPPGNYNVEGLLKRINNFNLITPTIVVLVDPNDAVLEITVKDLFTADNLTVDAKVMMVLNILEPQKFFENFIKAQRQVKIHDLEHLFAPEIYSVLKGIVHQQNSDSLYSAEGLRADIEKALVDAAQKTAERNGVALVQLRFIDFMGEAYEKLMKEKGEVYLLEQRTEIQRRVYEALSRDKINKFKSEHDFEEYIKRTLHDSALKDLLQEQELAEIRWQYRVRKEFEEATHKEKLKLVSAKGWAERMDIRMGILEKMKDLRRRAREKDFEVTKKEDEHKLSMEEKKLQQRSKATADALMTVLEGDAADRIMELEKIRAKQKMTPEQLLAIVAEASPEAARALAEKYKADSQVSGAQIKQLEKHLAEIKDMSKEDKDRMERLQKAALEAMSEVAKTRAAAGGETKIITRK